MIRGILSGGLFGLITVGLALSVASLLAPQPAGNTPPLAPQVDAPSEAVGDSAEGTTPDLASEAAGADPAMVEAPLVTAPQSAPDAVLADTESAALPETGQPESDLATPDDPAGTGAPMVAAGTETPVLPNPQSVAPQVPEPEQDLTLVTETAIPAPAPESVPEALPEPEMLAEPEVSVVAEDTEPVVDLPDDAALPMAELETPAEAEVAEIAEAPASLPAETEAPPSVEADSTTEVAEAEIAIPLTEEVPEAVVPEAGTEPEAADTGVAALPPEMAEPAPPAVVLRENDAASLPQGDAAIQVNRLGTAAEAAPEPAESEAIQLPAEDGPALERYAAAFDNPGDLPLMSVILIDDGTLPGASIALGSLPFPVTVALDPADPGATDRMQNYRAAGIEVMAIARLPQGARPADVMVTFESVFSTLPEAIAVLDTGDGGLQANSAVANQAMMRFAADGRGVVVEDAGLNMATRAAAAAGVPAGVIYRDLDGDGQDAQVMRRFLDQAAFRARQDGGVILLGRVRADTLSALTLWGGQNRAGQVAVAPLSFLLLAAD